MEAAIEAIEELADNKRWALNSNMEIIKPTYFAPQVIKNMALKMIPQLELLISELETAITILKNHKG